MRHLAVLLVVLSLTSPAAAHSLRVFAAVEGETVTGYGFFVGGGRPAQVDWSATMAGQEFSSGRTDDKGGFSFLVPARIVGPVTVTINSGEGHIASRDLGPERFGGVAAPSAAVASPDAPSPSPGAAVTGAAIQIAVAREIAPLLERIEQMDARMRFTDIISGLCLIFGIAGIALWARGRRG